MGLLRRLHRLGVRAGEDARYPAAELAEEPLLRLGRRRHAAQVLVKLLDKFDPKSDGADRSYADIYDESAKLLYEEIDYTLEGKLSLIHI